MIKQIEGRQGNLRWGYLAFSPLLLSELRLPWFEITAVEPGPVLAVIAGMHPNEVAAMEAALRLKDYFSRRLRRGAVRILPVLNMPGLYSHAEFVCPVDNKNINFLSPGNPTGSFSEVLIDRVLHEWARDADVFVDLHGGDLREEVAKFVMCQLTGDSAFDTRTRQLAHQYDADVIVEFDKDQTNNRGRATNELPWLGRHAVMSEGGANGVLDEENILFHFHGVANIARYLGLTDDVLPARQRRNQVVSNFFKIEASHHGRLYLDVAVGQYVQRGQTLGRIDDIFGQRLAEIHAPFAGVILMKVNHNITSQGEWLISLAPLDAGERENG